jgi:hypothetical protein
MPHTTAIQPRMIRLGVDHIPADILQRCRREGAIMEAKILCLEREILSPAELDLYEWTCDVDALNADPSEGRDLVVHREKIAA